MKTAIVILNWNGRLFLEAFLPGIIKSAANIADVIIADNQSTDDSVPFLQSNYPEVRIIHTGGNYGYAGGYNRALAQIDAEYFVLLNSDIEVTENWIEPVISLMDSDKTIAACQPKILSFKNREQFEYAGAGGGFIDRFGYPFCRGRIFQAIEKDIGQYDETAEIFWASGACLFVRATHFKEAGGLDEDFFAHMEEIDICWRFKHLGYKVMYCGGSKVYHVGGGSLDKSSPKKTYLNIRNNNTMLYKNLPVSQLYPVFFVRFFLDLLAAVKFLIDGGVRHFGAVVRAHLGFYFSLKKNKKKRKSIRQKRVSRIYNGNIVVAHFFKGVKNFRNLNPGKFTG
jgi:GT2 family glycosyltransferase